MRILLLILLSFPAFAELVPVNQYSVQDVTNTGNFGLTNAADTLEAINTHRFTRIRQDGDVEKVKFFIPSTPGLTGLTAFYVSIWRLDGSTYDRVGTSENLLSKMVAGVNELTLTTKISSVQVGDYIGFKMLFSVGAGTLLLRTQIDIGTGKTYSYTTAQGDLNIDWASGTAIDAGVWVQAFMTSPKLVVIGDSIVAGTPQSHTFIEAYTAFDLTSDIAYNIKLSLGNTWTFQNMAISSQSIDTIAERFQADVVNLKPQYVIIEGGINNRTDIGSNGQDGIDNVIEHYIDMINLCISNRIIPIIIEIMPCNVENLSDDVSVQYDSLIAQLKASVRLFPQVIYVQTRPEIGTRRPTGHSSNFWDIRQIYNADNIHYTTSGNQRLSELIVNAINGNLIYIDDIIIDGVTIQ
jgi:lysophospholipase L1-like esterase